MTKQEMLLNIELELISIFEKRIVSQKLIRRSKMLIKKWKSFTDWEEDTSYPLTFKIEELDNPINNQIDDCNKE
jgi:hypothetical protein